MTRSARTPRGRTVSARGDAALATAPRAGGLRGSAAPGAGARRRGGTPASPPVVDGQRRGPGRSPRPTTRSWSSPRRTKPSRSVIGSSSAPYLNALAKTYGVASNMQAGYPVSCPSLAAYVILTSGGPQGICDDDPPASHPLSVDNIFQQVATAGLQWREYAESMAGNCRATDSADLVYLVRHAPPPYYTTEAVPLPGVGRAPRHDDLRARCTARWLTGLPAYSFVTPNACDDMHGAPSCRTDLVKRGRRLAGHVDAADHRLPRLPGRAAGRGHHLGRGLDHQQPHPDAGRGAGPCGGVTSSAAADPLLDAADHRGGPGPAAARLRGDGHLAARRPSGSDRAPGPAPARVTWAVTRDEAQTPRDS